MTGGGVMTCATQLSNTNGLSVNAARTSAATGGGSMQKDASAQSDDCSQLSWADLVEEEEEMRRLCNRDTSRALVIHERLSSPSRTTLVVVVAASSYQKGRRPFNG